MLPTPRRTAGARRSPRREGRQGAITQTRGFPFRFPIAGIPRTNHPRAAARATHRGVPPRGGAPSRAVAHESGAKPPRSDRSETVTFPRPTPFTSICPHGQFASATRGSIFRVRRTPIVVHRTPIVADRHRRGDHARGPVVRPVRERLAGHGPGVVDRDRHLGGRENLRRRCHHERHGRARRLGGDGRVRGEPTTGTRALDGIEGSADTRLADTGSIDTTPYVVGGTLLLGLGAGFVAYSVRRERATAY